MSLPEVTLDEADLWRWFLDNERRLRSVRSTRDEVLEEFYDELNKYRRGIGVEVSEASNDELECVITARGDPENIPWIDRLVEAAPDVPGWEISALRPARGFDFVSDYEDVRFRPKRWWFEPLRKKGRPTALGLRVYIPEDQEAIEDETIENAVGMIIDTGIGERRALMTIQRIVIATLPEGASPERMGLIPIVELGAYLDWEEQREEGEGSAPKPR